MIRRIFMSMPFGLESVNEGPCVHALRSGAVMWFDHYQWPPLELLPSDDVTNNASDVFIVSASHSLVLSRYSTFYMTHTATAQTPAPNVQLDFLIKVSVSCARTKNYKWTWTTWNLFPCLFNFLYIYCIFHGYLSLIKGVRTDLL